MSAHSLAHKQLKSEASGDHVESVTPEDASSLTSASQISATARFVTATSANADYVITLPVPVTGHELILQINGSTACELRTAGSSVTINNVNCSGSTNELALVATQMYFCVATSSTSWVVYSYDKVGAVQSALTPNSV